MNVGDVLDGRFEIVERVATNGPRAVFRGIDRQTHDQVAIKLLTDVPAHDIERFRREVEILRTIRQRNLAQLIATGQTGTTHWMAQRWLSGSTLRDTLDEVGLGAQGAVAMAREVATALAAVHAAGVVHRDIKPSNIVSHQGSWVVIDFGVARMLREPGTQLTSTGTVVGTFGYMAPEQAVAQRTIAPSADTFAVGCVLYEALCGRPAFSADSLVALQAMLIAAEPPPVAALGPPGLPTTISRIVERCLRKDPAERPADGAELAALLASAEAAGIPDTAPRMRVEVNEEAPTNEQGPHDYVSVVLVGARPDAEQADNAWRTRITELFVPFGAEPVVLVDGSVVFVAPPMRNASSVVVAARAALAIHAALPDLMIAIATATQRGLLQSSLARAGTVIQSSAISALFAETSSSHVRIDQLTAAHLTSDFVLTTTDEEETFLVARKKA